MKFFRYSIIFLLLSCTHPESGFRFSNFKGSSNEDLSIAVKNQNIEEIRSLVKNDKKRMDVGDSKYGIPLISVCIANNKKKSFLELLRLGANPNQYNENCITPLITAIRLNKDCDLFFIKNLIENEASLDLDLSDKCSFTYDPLREIIRAFNNELEEECCLKILKLIDEKQKIDLSKFNDSENYRKNIVFYCLKVRNISVLKHLIVDLKCKFSEKVFIDWTVLDGAYGKISLKKILNDKEFIFKKNKYVEKAKKELLDYLNKVD